MNDSSDNMPEAVRKTSANLISKDEALDYPGLYSALSCYFGGIKTYWRYRKPV